MEPFAQPRAGAAPGSADGSTGATSAGRASGQVGPDRRLRPPTPRVALLIAGLAVLAGILYLGRDVLPPFVLGLLLVYLLDPPVEFLSRLYLPRWLAVLLVYGTALFVLIEGANVLLAPLVQQMSAFASGLPRYLNEIDRQLQHLTAAYRGLALPPEIRQIVDQAISGLGKSGSFDPTVLLPVFGSIAGLIASLFGYLVIPVWAFYLLRDRPALAARLDRALPEAWRADVWALIGITDRVIGQWLRGLLFLGFTVGVFTYIGLLVLSTVVDPLFGRYALLLAIVAGVFELLPIIGPILSAIPTGLLALTVSIPAVVAVAILYFVVQQVENYLLVPKIQGDAVRLHPSVVMFALILGAAIGGLVGAILALPITAAGRDVFRYLFHRLSEAAPSPAVPAPTGPLPEAGAVDRAASVGGRGEQAAAAAPRPGAASTVVDWPARQEPVAAVASRGSDDRPRQPGDA